MPIHYEIDTKSISDKEFYSIDYKIMGLAFSIHREMGRLWNEDIYKNELANRCRKLGYFDVCTELPINISHLDFKKSYYIDLLINNAIIYELKSVKILTGEHKNQTLNYLFLLGLQRGKLINMRPPSVEHKFVSTNITIKNRYDFLILNTQWFNLDEESLWLKKLMENLIQDWGVYLDINVYYDAIYYFRGGKDNIIKKVDITIDSKIIGSQKVHMLNSETAFHISSIKKGNKSYEKNIYRFIKYTPIKGVQWINFNRDKITFKTITK